MIQDRRFAFVFRLSAFLFAAVGLVCHIGVFRGVFFPGAFMYYTIQSNLLAVVFFGILTAKSTKNLRERRHGSSGCCPRLSLVVTVDLLVTLFVFWALLVPQGLDLKYLLSFDNIAVHTITPLLCLLDYLLFSQPRSLKYRNIYLVCILPGAYVLFTIIARYAGYVYRYTGYLGIDNTGTASVRFPYFFLDFDVLGPLVLAYMGLILLFFLLLSHILYGYNQRIGRPKASELTAS